MKIIGCWPLKGKAAMLKRVSWGVGWWLPRSWEWKREVGSSPTGHLSFPQDTT